MSPSNLVGSGCHIIVHSSKGTWKFLGVASQVSVAFDQVNYGSSFYGGVREADLSFKGKLLDVTQPGDDKLRAMAVAVLNGNLEGARDFAFDVLMNKESSGA